MAEIPQTPQAVASALLGLKQFAPAPDRFDPTVEWLGQARQYAADAGPYRPALDAAIDSLLMVRSTAWAAMDRLDALTRQYAVVGGLPQRQINQQVFKEFDQSASAAADRCEQSIDALRAQIDRGRRRVEFRALQAKPEDAQRVELLVSDFETRDVEQILDAWEGMRASDDPECETFALAAERFARTRLTTTPVRRLANASQMHAREIRVDGVLTRENTVLNALLRSIQEWKDSSIDPALLLAGEILDSLLLPCWKAIVGYRDVNDLPATRSGSWDFQQVPPYPERLSGWLSRHWPSGRADSGFASGYLVGKRGGAEGPPGWSPLAERTAIPTGPAGGPRGVPMKRKPGVPNYRVT